MYVVVASTNLTHFNVYGPFVNEEIAEKWGDENIGKNDLEWFVEKVQKEIVVDDPNLPEHHLT